MGVMSAGWDTPSLWQRPGKMLILIIVKCFNCYTQNPSSIQWQNVTKSIITMKLEYFTTPANYTVMKCIICYIMLLQSVTICGNICDTRWQHHQN